MATGLMDQALYRVMQQLVNSADGIKRAVRATNDGQPALAGVDGLLRRELGSEYERANKGTWWAGFTVAQVMREMGYVEARTGKCPPECVARQGTVWKPKGSAKLAISAAERTRPAVTPAACQS
jgi:hypothetical protein